MHFSLFGASHVSDMVLFRRPIRPKNILFSAGEKISGIQYNPESIHGMRENLERILQFMATKRIRMHQITSKEILEGNLKAVMRLILALAAHYKPQSVRHHDVSYESIGKEVRKGEARVELLVRGKHKRQSVILKDRVARTSMNCLI